MKTELKPCPFCGGEAKVIFSRTTEVQWKVRCKSVDCDVRPTTSWFIEKEDAIDRWNRRTEVTE